MSPIASIRTVYYYLTRSVTYAKVKQTTTNGIDSTSEYLTTSHRLKRSCKRSKREKNSMSIIGMNTYAFASDIPLFQLEKSIYKQEKRLKQQRFLA